MPIRRRPRVLAYALALAVPTLVLLGFGMQSVRRQQQAIVQLEAANRRLAAEQLARTLASRVAAAATACLADPAWSRPESRTAAGVRAIGARHPVSRHLVLVQDRDVVTPRLTSPVDALPFARERLAGACASRVAEAEAREFEGRADAAVATYRACLDAAEDSLTRARVLARLARAQRRLGQGTAAATVYRTLALRYSDDSDRFARPFGIVAALELHDLDPRGGAPILQRARDALAAGRWDVSDEQARYFLDEMRARLGSVQPRTGDTSFLEALALARSVQAALPLQAAPGEDGVQTDELVLEGRRTRVYHAAVTRGPIPVRAVVVPDPEWIEGSVLPDLARAAGLGPGARLVLDDQAPRDAGVVGTANGALGSWRVFVPAAGSPAAGRWAPVALQGAITLAVSAVLAVGVLLVVRDARREQALSQLRSQFVSAASHELRTPLAMILLYAQTLLEDVDADREERRGSYEIIAEESERLRHLLDKVLDFSRIDAGRRSYRLEVRDLDESVRSAIRLFAPQLARRGFHLRAEIECVPDVRHDAEAITGAVLNLLDNAAKYSGPARDIHLTLAATASHATIAVRDDGIGIPAEELPHIGEQFFRSRLAATIGGYGLGLHLVSHAMAAHGGRLVVESVEGKGSTFTLVLPRAGAPEVPA